MRVLVGFVAALLLISGCGSDGAERVNANTDASALLRSTAQNLAGIESATVYLKVKADGGTAQLTGPFAQAEQKGELPRFAFIAKLSSGTRSELVGATWTGERGYATLDGVAYEIPSIFVQQLGAGLQQASPLASLDVSKWVTNPRNEGLAEVAGVETVKITGGADVAAVLADAERLSASLGSLQTILGKQFSLTPADRRRATDAVKDAKVEVYSGADDSILRRLVFTATIDDEPVSLNLTLMKVGEDVSISDVKGARPFSELTSKLRTK